MIDDFHFSRPDLLWCGKSSGCGLENVSQFFSLVVPDITLLNLVIKSNISLPSLCVVSHVCVFVCDDVGNVLEWKFPPEAVLDDNIEFKSMASGLHNITTDFM